VAEPALPLEPLPTALRNAIVAWYEATGRKLAFRATRDPYAILVSELMAQQTQAARAAEAWTAWMARFPTVRELAAAPAADVLRAWAGLGYNRRAIQLHRAAKTIVAEHGGSVPETVEELRALPGVGPYTARAVAAIAFGLPVGAVDTNVRRVLGRIAAGGAEGLAPGQHQALADAAVPVGRAGDWTHAVMDVGALLCRPRNPRCPECPAVAWCRYAAGERAAPRSSAVRAMPRRPDAAFPSTTRWLRGRIIARTRDAADGAWTPFADPMGVHDPSAVREAVVALGAEGLLDVRETPDGPEARLPGSPRAPASSAGNA
jgi:A/G-specific adenine glycosylase